MTEKQQYQKCIDNNILNCFDCRYFQNFACNPLSFDDCKTCEQFKFQHRKVKTTND